MFMLSMRCVFMCRSRNWKKGMKQVRETRIWGNLCRQKRRQQAQVRQVQWSRRKVQLLLYSPRFLQEREAIAERSQVFHSERENLMSSSSQDLISTGKFVALFSGKNRLNQDTFSEREEFSLRHQQVIVSNEICIIFSYPTNVGEISSWWKQRSFASWSEIWIYEAGTQSGIS